MLRDTFKEKSNEALRNKDADTRRIMNNILSRFLEVEKAEKFGGWTEALEQDTIRSYIKSLQKGMEQLKDGPLRTSYQQEIDVLATFLPRNYSEDELRAIAAPYAANAKGLGPFMGAVMKDHRGKVDGDMLRRIGLELGLK